MSRLANIPLEGEFNCWTRDFDLPDLIYAVCQTGETGLLRFVSVEAEKTLFLRDGGVIFATSSSSDDRLGEYLLRMGKVRLKVLSELSREVRPGKRLGAVLVERGVLDPKELVAAVIGHVRAMVVSLFRWTDGWYGFSAQALPTKETITLDISTPDLILAGVRQIDSWRRILKGVGDLDTCYRAAPGREAVIRHMDVDGRAVEILAALREPLTVEAVCARSDLHDFEVCRLLWVYRSVGLIERVDAAALAAVSAPVESGVSSAPEATAPEAAAASSTVEAVVETGFEVVVDTSEDVAGADSPAMVVEAEVVVEPDATSPPADAHHPFELWRSSSGAPGESAPTAPAGDSGGLSFASAEPSGGEKPSEAPVPRDVEGERVRASSLVAGDADLEGLGMVLHNDRPKVGRGAGQDKPKK